MALQVLRRLSAAGTAHREQDEDEMDMDMGDEVSPAELNELTRSLHADADAFWQAAAAGEQLPLGAVPRSLACQMAQTTPLPAASCYLALLGGQGGPTASLFEPVAWEAALRVLRAACTCGPVGAGEDDAGMDVDAPSQRPQASQGTGTQGSGGTQGGAPPPPAALSAVTAALGDVALALSGPSAGSLCLSTRPETLRATAESMVGLATAGAVLATSSSKDKAKQPGDGGVASGAYAALAALVTPPHGSPETTAAVVLCLLTPSMLGSSSAPAVRARGGRASSRVAATAACAWVTTLATGCPASLPAIAALARHLCLTCGDKAESRPAAVAAVMAVIAALPVAQRPDFDDFVVRLSRHARPAKRALAVDVAAAMTVVPGARSGPCCDVLVSRCSDAAATIRVRALGAIAATAAAWSASGDPAAVAAIGRLLCGREAVAAGTPRDAVAEAGDDDSNGDLVSIILRRCNDDKAPVRRAALALLEALASLPPHTPPLGLGSCAMVAASTACADPLPSVRRAAMGAATALWAASPHDGRLATLWLSTVPAMVGDTEAALADKAAEAFAASVIDALTVPLTAGGCAVLTALGGDATGEVVLTGAVAAAHRRGRLHPSVAAALQAAAETHAGTDVAVGAWLLLAAVAAHRPSSLRWSTLQAAWADLEATTHPVTTPASSRAIISTCLLRCVASAAAMFPPAAAAALATALESRLTAFTLDPPAAGAHAAALAGLSCVGSGWASRVLQAATYVMGDPGHRGGASCHRLNAVFAAGEVAAVCPQAPECPSVALLIQSLLVDTDHRDDEGTTKDGGGPPVVRAYALAALGKLCLGDGDLAERCLPAIARELLSPVSPPAARLNAAIVLADLAVRHTAAADPHAPSALSAALGDPTEVVRRTSAILLAGLLQRDVMKPKPALWHACLPTLADGSPAVRAAASHLMTTVIAAKAPMLAYAHFVDALLALCGCGEGSPGAAAAVAAADDAAASRPPGVDAGPLRLRGMSGRPLRAMIHTSLLAILPVDQRASLLGQLCSGVLTPLADGGLDWRTPAGGEALVDTLSVLACPEMRLGRPGGRSGAVATGDGDGDGEGDGEGDDPTAVAAPGAAAAKAAKARLVSALLRQGLAEHVLPLLATLKRSLQAAKSPLVGPIVICLRSLLRDYKGEAVALLAADPQLAREMEHDLTQLGKADGETDAACPRGRTQRSAPRRVAEASPVFVNRATPHTPAGPASGHRLAGVDPGRTPAAARCLRGDGPPEVPLSVPRLRATIMAETNDDGENVVANGRAVVVLASPFKDRGALPPASVDETAAETAAVSKRGKRKGAAKL